MGAATCSALCARTSCWASTFARDTASSRAKVDAQQLVRARSAEHVAATISGAASQHLPFTQLYQTSRHESKDLLDLKQRTEKAFAERRRMQLTHSWNTASSGREQLQQSPLYVPPLALPLGLNERRHRTSNIRQQHQHQRPSSADDAHQPSLSSRLMATRHTGRLQSDRTLQQHTPRPSFRQMEAEARMRVLGWNEGRMTRAWERPFAAPLLREHAPNFWTRGLGPPSTWPAWDKPKVSRFGWRPGASQTSPPAYI